MDHERKPSCGGCQIHAVLVVHQPVNIILLRLGDQSRWQDTMGSMGSDWNRGHAQGSASMGSKAASTSSNGTHNAGCACQRGHSRSGCVSFFGGASTIQDVVHPFALC